VSRFLNRDINVKNYGNGMTSVREYVNWVRVVNSNDSFFQLEDSVTYPPHDTTMADFMYLELQETEYSSVSGYCFGMVRMLLHIVQSQSHDGTAVIRIHDILVRPVVESMFVLSGLYERVYVTKPSVSNVFSRERFIICNQFTRVAHNTDLLRVYADTISRILAVQSEKTNQFMHSFLRGSVPYFFVNRIEDVNMVMGYQLVELMEQLATVYRHKNRDEKLETMRRTNIHKSAQWCEKHKVPFSNNRFKERPNIFSGLDKSLPLVRNIFLCKDRAEPDENDNDVYSEYRARHVSIGHLGTIDTATDIAQL
jgi:hypothetical protein